VGEKKGGKRGAGVKAIIRRGAAQRCCPDLAMGERVRSDPGVIVQFANDVFHSLYKTGGKILASF
jgi:hypothetical protein